MLRTRVGGKLPSIRRISLLEHRRCQRAHHVNARFTMASSIRMKIAACRLALLPVLRAARHKRALSTPSQRIVELVTTRPPPGGVIVDVTGWVRSARFQKQYSFMEINDGTSARSLQVVWRTDSEALFSGQRPLAGTGSCVRVRGTLVSSPKPGQDVEVQATDVSLVGGTDADTYPLQKKAHTVEYLRDMVHLRSRLAAPAAIFRLRHTLAKGALAYLDSQGYISITTPVLTSNDCEGAGELFTVAALSETVPSLAAAADNGRSGAAGGNSVVPSPESAGFFGKRVFLTVSGQLHLEAFAVGLGRVYAWGPTFRAENSHTARHASEFWMLEPEVAPGSMNDAITLAQSVVQAAARCALEERNDDLALLSDKMNATPMTSAVAAAVPSSRRIAAEEVVRSRTLVERLERAVAAPFQRMTFREALRTLESSGQKFTAGPATWATGLATEHERFIAERVVGGPVFVTDYPSHMKPFYMRENDDEETVAAFDLLVPGVGELAGGSAREERQLRLGRRMAALGLLSTSMAAAVATAISTGASDIRAPVADTNGRTLDWYLDTRRYGGVPHAGFGLGFDRLVMWATGTDNIRDVLPVPRVPGSCRL